MALYRQIPGQRSKFIPGALTLPKLNLIQVCVLVNRTFLVNATQFPQTADALKRAIRVGRECLDTSAAGACGAHLSRGDGWDIGDGHDRRSAARQRPALDRERLRRERPRDRKSTRLNSSH